MSGVWCWLKRTFQLFRIDATVAYEMALEQIIADLDDLEERVENLNVDQKTNEDILLNVLKRVDETEKDLRKVLQRMRRFSVVAMPCPMAHT